MAKPLLFTVAISLLTLGSCTGLVPISSNDAALANPSVRFSVLGMISARVDSISKRGKGGIKTHLLEIAKKKYPSADAVLDLTYTGVTSGQNTRYVVEATVIQFQ